MQRINANAEYTNTFTLGCLSLSQKVFFFSIINKVCFKLKNQLCQIHKQHSMLSDKMYIKRGGS